MRHRIGQLMGTSQGGMWVGTFHGLAHRLLRAHHMDANLPQDFQILDSEDQLRLLKRLIKAMNLDARSSGRRARQCGTSTARKMKAYVRIIFKATVIRWNRPGRRCIRRIRKCAIVRVWWTSPSLPLRAHQLWLNKPHILQHYRERFTNILVDEFQDNYIFIRVDCLLAGDTGKVMIVGDDDQSIYGWRGAQVENIQAFP